MTRVLITGARAPVALEIARRLDTIGAEVHLADSLRLPGARFSRSVRAYHTLPRPIDDPPAYGRALAALVDQVGVDLVVPTCEEVFYVSRYRELVKARVLTDAFESILALHDKFRFATETHSIHARPPETVRVDSAFRPSATELRETVLKPVYSRFATLTLVGPRAAGLLRARSDGRDWIAQRRVRGAEVSTYGFAWRGRLLAHVVYQSQYRLDGGSGVLFQDVTEAHPAIRDFVRELVAGRRYSGQIAFDIIEDEERPWVLECNPRATSGVHLFGVSDAFAQVLLDPEAATELVEPPRGARLARKLAFALPFAAEVTRLEFRRWPRFLRDAWSTPDAVHARGDAAPFFAAGFSLAEIVAIAARRRLPLTAASTHDIEYDGQPLPDP